MLRSGSATASSNFGGLAVAFGTSSAAHAGLAGNLDTAVALVSGAGSTAFAGAGPTTSGGNGDLAVGNMLDVAATGANQLVNSVFNHDRLAV